MTGEIINRVAQSGIVTLNPEDFLPKGPRFVLDIKDQLFQGLILREKDFREFVKTHDWAQYRDGAVALTCSADAIVPAWAYMLMAAQLEPYAPYVCFGPADELERDLWRRSLDAVDFARFAGQRVVVKGCGNLSPAVYVEITRRLRPFAKSILYGEPCSTVPIFKKGRDA